MSKRQQQEFKEARQLLGDDRIIAFLRASKTSSHSLLACKLINDDLDGGNELSELFDSDNGFFLKVSLLAKNHYKVEFGCSADPEAGDGGEWDVTFLEDRQIGKMELVGQWIA